VLGKEAAVECVGAVLDEVYGFQGVGAVDRDVGEVGIGGV
jgi:hypothetical protein